MHGSIIGHSAALVKVDHANVPKLLAAGPPLSAQQRRATRRAARAAEPLLWPAEASGLDRAQSPVSGDLLLGPANAGPLYLSLRDCCDKAACGVKGSCQCHETHTDQRGNKGEDGGEIEDNGEVGESGDSPASWEHLNTVIELKPCWCRKWFCKHCGPRMGTKLKNELLFVLRQFSGVFGVTLTIDPKLFKTPQAAWAYVTSKRLISRFVRELRRRGFLPTNRWFCVCEFQAETNMPHWHLVLETGFVPYGDLVEVWSSYRPADAPSIERVTKENYKGREPGFGSVRFSKDHGAERACYYVAKYFCKWPTEGYPQWVYDRQGRLPKYSHSRGFFSENLHSDECFCRVCKGETKSDEAAILRKKPKPIATVEDDQAAIADRFKAPRRRQSFATVGERIERCAQSTTVVQVERFRKPSGQIVERRSFCESIEIPFDDVQRRLQPAWEGGPITIDPGELDSVREYATRFRALTDEMSHYEKEFENGNARAGQNEGRGGIG